MSDDRYEIKSADGKRVTGYIQKESSFTPDSGTPEAEKTFTIVLYVSGAIGLVGAIQGFLWGAHMGVGASIIFALVVGVIAAIAGLILVSALVSMGLSIVRNWKAQLIGAAIAGLVSWLLAHFSRNL